MRRLIILSVLALLVSVPALAQGPSAKGTDLSWMTGRYSSDGLEENWAPPRGGSMASLVRGMDGDGQMNMMEFIVIEEVDNSLVLRLKQWNPGMEPRYFRSVMSRKMVKAAGDCVHPNERRSRVTTMPSNLSPLAATP